MYSHYIDVQVPGHQLYSNSLNLHSRWADYIWSSIKLLKLLGYYGNSFSISKPMLTQESLVKCVEYLSFCPDRWTTHFRKHDEQTLSQGQSKGGHANALKIKQSLFNASVQRCIVFYSSKQFLNDSCHLTISFEIAVCFAFALTVCSRIVIQPISVQQVNLLEINGSPKMASTFI